MKKTQDGILQSGKEFARTLMPGSQLASAGVDNVMATVKPSPPRENLKSGSVGRSNSLTTGSVSRSTSSRSMTAPSAKSAAEPEEMELLLTKSNKSRSQSTFTATSVKFYIMLLLVGLIGSLGCLWTMLYTAHGEEVAYNLGLERVANSLENILQLLAYPVLMFLIVLSAYAAQQLYRAYRAANDPETYRQQRGG